MTADIRSRAERLARLLEEQAEIAAQISELKAEAKADGYDPALLMKTARLLAMDAEKRRKQLDQHELFDTYLSAVGLVAERVEPADEPAPPSGDLTVTVSVGDKTGEIPLSTLNAIVDGSRTEAGRAVLATAVAAAKSARIPDEYPEMPAFLRRTRPVATEITA